MSAENYAAQMADISRRAEEMKAALHDPIVDDNGRFIAEAATRAERLEEKTKGTIFEMAGRGGGTIQGTASNALRAFVSQRGSLPSDDLLASAHLATENLLFATNEKKQIGGLVLESASLDTTDGILMRDRMVALILPAMLQSITSQIVSFIPGTFNQSEIFKVYRNASTTFGDVTAGDRLDWNYNGQYSSMDQRHLTIAGNGIKTGSAAEFDLNSNTKFGKVYPFKKKSIKIIHDRDVVAKDDGQGNLAGTFLVGATSVTVTGTVNYATGVIHPVFSVAPAVGIEVHVGFDVDIEKDPTLIPAVNHEMDSRVLYPHEAAISASTTLQALWGMRREYNMNADSMAMLAMRNLLAADKDRKHLRDLYFYAKNSDSWTYTFNSQLSGISMQDHYETLLPKLLSIDSTLQQNTGTSGLVGIVIDSKSAAIIKSMRSFVAAPGYQPIPQPHYAGRLFGMWDIYVNPQGEDYTCLCYAKGRDIGQAAYLAGDAIPAMQFKHAMQSDLKYNNTLYELAYRDLQPFDGRNYLTTLNLVPA